jgi:PAS domain S-box-containing protein
MSADAVRKPPTPPAGAIRVLMLEDTVEDAELNAVQLTDAGIGFTSKRVETRDTFIRAIDEFRPDVILSDFRLPTFDGREALHIAHERCPDTPVIMVTGAVGDEIAVELLKAGARDYVLKDRLARLPVAVLRALAEEQESRRRLAAEAALRESEALHRSFVAASPDGVGVIDSEGKVVFASPKILDLLRLPPGTDLRGKDAIEWIAPEDRDRARMNLARNARGEIVTDADYRLLRADGTSVYVEMNGAPILDAGAGPRAIVTIVRDATQRREAVEALRKSEQKYRTIFEESFDGLFVSTPDGRIVDINRKGIEMFGYASKQEVQRLNIATDVYANPAERPRILALVQAQGAAEFEVEAKKKSGERILAHCALTAVRDAKGTVTSYRGIIHDITERKRAEEALRRSEQRLREVYENSPLAYQALDANGRYLDVNPAWCELMDMPREDVLGRQFTDLLSAASVAAIEERFPRFKAEGGLRNAELTLVRRDGTRIEIQLDGRVVYDSRGHVRQMHCMLHDITERKRAELALRRFNRALKTLSSGNEALVRANDEKALLESMCRVLVEHGGYRAAWIGYAGPAASEPMRVATWAGEERGCFSAGSTCLVSTAPSDPVNVVLSTRAPHITHNFTAEHLPPTCRQDALAAGLKSSIALPLRSEDEVFGVLTIYAAEIEAFDSDEVKLLAELANDLSYGMHALRVRADRERGAQRLAATLQATIQALASTVELRDPYTAGHQQRVAQLAVAIGRTLHMPDERLRGLRLAAMVHDIGKIYVPAEILSRPGALSSIEYGMVQTHVDAGCDILKPIDFPWPIAEIVRQHHERLDGSGYPRHLMAEAILPEAKILAVSDVVEAMSAHRPYRPGLGLDAALAEIERGSGRLFDADVVQACVTLFRHEGFHFEATPAN